MNRKRFYYMVLGIAAVGLACTCASYFRKHTEPEPAGLDSLDINAYLDRLTEEISTGDTDRDFSVTENIRTVDESVVPFMVPGLCGYNPRDLRMGVITVRKDIDSTVYANAFPKVSLQPGKVDSIADTYIYIKPMDVFPQGEYGQIAYILSNDSVIQIQFVRGGVDDMVKTVSSRLDAVSGQLSDLASQMEAEAAKK